MLRIMLQSMFVLTFFTSSFPSALNASNFCCGVCSGFSSPSLAACDWPTEVGVDWLTEELVFDWLTTFSELDPDWLTEDELCCDWLDTDGTETVGFPSNPNTSGISEGLTFNGCSFSLHLRPSLC